MSHPSLSGCHLPLGIKQHAYQWLSREMNQGLRRGKGCFSHTKIRTRLQGKPASFRKDVGKSARWMERQTDQDGCRGISQKDWQRYQETKTHYCAWQRKTKFVLRTLMKEMNRVSLQGSRVSVRVTQELFNYYRLSFVTKAPRKQQEELKEKILRSIERHFGKIKSVPFFVVFEKNRQGGLLHVFPQIQKGTASYYGGEPSGRLDFHRQPTSCSNNHFSYRFNKHAPMMAMRFPGLIGAGFRASSGNGGMNASVVDWGPNPEKAPEKIFDASKEGVRKSLAPFAGYFPLEARINSVDGRKFSEGTVVSKGLVRLTATERKMRVSGIRKHGKGVLVLAVFRTLREARSFSQYAKKVGGRFSARTGGWKIIRLVRGRTTSYVILSRRPVAYRTSSQKRQFRKLVEEVFYHTGRRAALFPVRVDSWFIRKKSQ